MSTSKDDGQLTPETALHRRTVRRYEPEPEDLALGVHVRRLAVALGFTESELARRCGVSVRAFNKMVDAQRGFRPRVLKVLAQRDCLGPAVFEPLLDLEETPSATANEALTAAAGVIAAGGEAGSVAVAAASDGHVLPEEGLIVDQALAKLERKTQLARAVVRAATRKTNGGSR